MSRDAPRISIVIPTRNRADLVPLAIESALSQSYSAHEIVVVDDGSTDATADVLTSFQGRVRPLRTTGLGLGAARNEGVRATDCEYLVFLDDDDLLPPWALSSYADLIRLHAWPSVVMSAVHRFDTPGDTAQPVHASVKARSWPDYLAAASARPPVTIAAAIRRSAFDRIGGFLEHRAGSEDQDLFLRLGRDPGFVFVDEPPLYAYRQWDETMSRNPDQLEDGVRTLLERNRRGVYGGDRARERSIVLARNVRYAASRLVAAGHPHRALLLLARGVRHLVRAQQVGEAGVVTKRAVASVVRNTTHREVASRDE